MREESVVLRDDADNSTAFENTFQENAFSLFIMGGPHFFKPNTDMTPIKQTHAMSTSRLEGSAENSTPTEQTTEVDTVTTSILTEPSTQQTPFMDDTSDVHHSNERPDNYPRSMITARHTSKSKGASRKDRAYSLKNKCPYISSEV